MTFTRAALPLQRRLGAVADLTRVGTVVAGACLCVIGARLAGGPTNVARVLWATSCVALLIAFAQVVNDIIDVEVDRIEKPRRPLVCGAIDVRTATALAATLGGGGLVAGLMTGPRFLAIATLILLASWAYSAWWKGSVGFGNAVVALLASAPVTFGAAAAGRADGAAWAAQAVVFVFMAAFEVLKTGRDLDGDRAAGLRTIATRYGLRTTYRVAAVLCVAFALASIVPALFADHPIAYAAVMGGAVVPTETAALRLLRSPGDAADLHPALTLLRVAWFAGIASLVFV